ncbi:hypothetical protein Tco_0892257 [Tanacetum coccineum]|uniref:Uncharacterized protein n=1 Tax=Tanacetum coccineum TaxID=301880 RepID=A0ABQ5C5D2_9ASTR
MSQAVPSQSTASAFYQNTARPKVSKAVLSQSTARPYFPRPVFHTSTGRPYYPRMDNVRPRASSSSTPKRASRRGTKKIMLIIDSGCSEYDRRQDYSQVYGYYKTKHIQIRHHFISDCYDQRIINVVKVHRDDNVANLLTKGFDLARRFDAILKRRVGFEENASYTESTAWPK